MGGDHKCPVCQATFTRPQHVARHMRSRESPFVLFRAVCGQRGGRKGGGIGGRIAFKAPTVRRRAPPSLSISVPVCLACCGALSIILARHATALLFVPEHLPIFCRHWRPALQMSTLRRSVRSQVCPPLHPSVCRLPSSSLCSSDLLSRHVNKCHANIKSDPAAAAAAAATKRKGTAATRATTSKQACDQCVQSSLPCDGCNPCCTSSLLSSYPIAPNGSFSEMCTAQGAMYFRQIPSTDSACWTRS